VHILAAMESVSRLMLISALAMIVVLGGCMGAGDSRRASDVSARAKQQEDPNAKLVAKGAKQFLLCNSCHSMTADGPEMEGPHLEGIVNRPSASVEGFDYTTELKALNIRWDEAQLDRFLEKPQADVGGLCKPFMGMSNPQSRKALIAYLKDPRAV